MDQVTPSAAVPIDRFHVVGNYPSDSRILHSFAWRYADGVPPSRGLPGYRPPRVQYEIAGATAETEVRDVDLALLCHADAARAAEHLSRLLRARRGDAAARAALAAAMVRVHGPRRARSSEARSVASRHVVSSASPASFPAELVSHKGATLLRLSQQGYPVPDFAILTSEAYRPSRGSPDGRLADAVSEMERLTGQLLGASDDPLVLALRCAMPRYAPGVMPTYLNVGVTERVLAALEREFGADAAQKMYLNNLRNMLLALDPASGVDLASRVHRHLDTGELERLIDEASDRVRRRDPRLADDAARQTEFFTERAYRHFEQNQDLLVTLCRGARHSPAMILQKMVCTVRCDEACAGVLFSRNPKTGDGVQLQMARNIFGEEIMTGTVEAEEVEFRDRQAIQQVFPAVHHFAPQLAELERVLESPVTIEFAVEAAARGQFFALLQLNHSGMSGRAAFISVVDLHQAGGISRKRVTELICPYHVKQIETDTIDPATFHTLDRFCTAVPILPRGAVSARIFFSGEAALRAKREGERVCFCRRTFTPTDTVVMREMDAILSLTAAAIHVVTICQSFGVPAMLSLDRDGVTLSDSRGLTNAAGETIDEGQWITISSRRHAVYRGRATFKPARLLRYMQGEAVQLEPGEVPAFEAMAYAYRYYQQLVRSLRFDQITTLNEVIRLVNLELRGEVEEARKLVNGWFDNHEPLYVDEVLRSDMGDHLNQATTFDMLTPDRKVRFFRRALARCASEGLSGYSAGAFMLGRFVAVQRPVAFWQAFGPAEIALLVNEWVLFEKYMQLLHEVGERKVLRARRKMLSDGLAELHLHAGAVRTLLPLKLCGSDLEQVRAELAPWSDGQTALVLELLAEPFGRFYQYDAPWSLGQLEGLCQEAGIDVPAPDERGVRRHRGSP